MPSERQASLFGDYKTATLSPCGRYRYTLGRRWSDGGRVCLFVMLNPSTADAELDDPTIRRCIGFAKREGCAALRVVNLFAWRSPDPRALLAATDPVGPDNDEHIQREAAGADLIICGWGAAGAKHHERAATVRAMLGEAACLGKTAAGHPAHPLYVRGDRNLEAS